MLSKVLLSISFTLTDPNPTDSLVLDVAQPLFEGQFETR